MCTANFVNWSQKISVIYCDLVSTFVFFGKMSVHSFPNVAAADFNNYKMKYS